jgi:hypothetical protein
MYIDNGKDGSSSRRRTAARAPWVSSPRSTRSGKLVRTWMTRIRRSSRTSSPGRTRPRRRWAARRSGRCRPTTEGPDRLPGDGQHVSVPRTAAGQEPLGHEHHRDQRRHRRDQVVPAADPHDEWDYDCPHNPTVFNAVVKGS